MPWLARVTPSWIVDVDAPPRKAQAVDVEDVGSPQKKGGASPTLADIQALLEHQSRSLRESQREDIGQAVQTAVARSEKRTLSALDDIKQGFLKQTEQTRKELATVIAEQKSMKDQQQDLLFRISKLEARPALTGSTTASETADRKPALVFGGWPTRCKRATVLHELQGVIHDVGADDMMDERPWTPGADARSGPGCFSRSRGGGAG